MIGHTLSFLHSLREAFRKSITPAGLNAYEQFQAHYDRLEEKARPKRQVRKVRAERTERLHHALRGTL